MERTWCVSVGAVVMALLPAESDGEFRQGMHAFPENKIWVIHTENWEKAFGTNTPQTVEPQVIIRMPGCKGNSPELQLGKTQSIP